MQGVSLRPLIEGKDVPWRDFAFAESNYWARAIVAERFKYVMGYRPQPEEDFIPPGPDPDAVGLEQLFDLRDDPGETKNLAEDPRYTGTLSDLRKSLFHFEDGLQRRPLREGHPRRVVRRWGDALRERWAELER